MLIKPRHLYFLAGYGGGCLSLLLGTMFTGWLSYVVYIAVPVLFYIVSAFTIGIVRGISKKKQIEVVL